MEAALALCLHAAAHYNDIAAAWRFTVNLTIVLNQKRLVIFVAA
jgi:hypothetical protein